MADAGARRVAAIEDGAATLQVPLPHDGAARLVRLIDELLRWNRAYNLTAVSDADAMVTHHILDSLSAHADLSGAQIADVGTGAGFPGLPLALVNPQRSFTLIDASAKKLRFVSHAAQLLGLDNVQVLHARAEALQPRQPFDCVVARALAPLPVMLELLGPLCTPPARLLAMKGRWPEPGARGDALPPGWLLQAVRRVQVPGLAAQRHLVCLQRTS